MKQSILVFGMHRSGTSALAGALSASGVNFGQPDELMPPHIQNPKGFFEHMTVHNICKNLMNSCNSSWDKISEFCIARIPEDTKAAEQSRFLSVARAIGSQDLWGIKEPRLSLVYPVFRSLIEDPVIVICLRNPLEVAKSLKTRNEFSLRHGVALWEAYNKSALQVSQGHRRIFVDYARLVSCPKSEMRHVFDKLGEFGVDISRLSMDRGQAHIDSRLHREHADGQDLAKFLTSGQARLWQGLKDPYTRDWLAEDLSEVSLSDLQDLEDVQKLRNSHQIHNLILELEKSAGKIRQMEDLLLSIWAHPRIFSKIRRRYKLLESLSRKQSLFSHRRRDLFAASAKKRNLTHTIMLGSDQSITAYRKRYFPEPGAKAVPKSRSPLKKLSRRFTPKMEENWRQKVQENGALDIVKQGITKVSIIMPTRNRRSRIFTAIQSVLDQTYGNWELIIIDDCSTDGTKAAIAERFDDARIGVVSSDGTGVGNARNTGLARATGDIIAYLDSDNAWMPDYLLLSLAGLRASGKAAGYSILKKYHRGLDQESSIKYLANEFSREQLLTENFIDLNVYIHTSDLMDTYGVFDQTLERMVDWDLIIRHCDAGDPAVFDFVGARYDASPAPDRITNCVEVSYQDIVRAKHQVDWQHMTKTLPARQQDLVSIIICVHNIPELTNACLTSLFKNQAGEDFEVILVDNGSDRTTKKVLERWERQIEQVNLITNPANFNFALGNNIGFARSRGRRVVFLNNDTRTTPEWLSPLVRPLEDPAIKGTQPRLLYPDGSIQGVGLAFSKYSALAYSIYLGLSGDVGVGTKPRKCAALTAACLAMRAEDFCNAKGFDPIFRNGQEDVDLCLRLGDGDPVFQVCPDSIIVHHEGQTEGRGTHIKANRKVFSDRWARRNFADDEALYAADGVVASHYIGDSLPDEPDRLRIFSPTCLEIDEGGMLMKPAAGHMAAQAGKVQILVPCPRPTLRKSWGDYHFGVSLVKAMAMKGIEAEIVFLDDWARVEAKTVVVLRGLSRFDAVAELTPHQTRIMWMISHPEKISDEELAGYDFVFVASETWAANLQARGIPTCVLPLLQCTDPDRFFPTPKLRIPAYHNLFVGNSRKVLREVVKKAIDEDVPLEVVGEMWEGLIPDSWIKSQNISNHELGWHYRQADVVLNDHWNTMRINGFVSDRIFDLLACGATFVTDDVVGMPDDLRRGATFFDETTTLQTSLDKAKALLTDKERLQLSAYVRSEHSFATRAQEIFDSLR